MGRREITLLITIVVNIALIGLKFVLAGVSGSLALRASAWHSFSDVAVSAIVAVIATRGRLGLGAPSAGQQVGVPQPV